jgi:uncharacterized membrane protein
LATLIERQIEDWEKRGVIDGATAVRLRSDIGSSLAAATAGSDRSARRFSFLQVVLFFAAISLGAAIILFIAANWDLIPRIVRAGGAVFFVFAGLLGGAWVNRRSGKHAALVEEACYLVAGAAFMASIALVGQMYHISGDEREAAMLYAAGLGLSGFAVRSNVLVALAAAWITFWQVDGPHAANLLSLQFLVFAVAIGAGLAFAFAAGARWLRYVLYVAGAVGLLPFIGEVLEFIVDTYEAIPDDIRVAVWVVVWLFALAVLLAHRWLPSALEKLPGAGGGRIMRFFFLGLVACAFLHGELGDDTGLIIAGSMTIIYVLALLYAHGRDNRLIRYLCYAIFVGEILLIYGETVFSMLGTSGFFLVLAVVLVIVALAVYALERRLKRKNTQGAADA